MAGKTNRFEIEQKVIQNSRKIRLNRETGCYEESSLYEYWEAWRSLVVYYENNNDTEMSIELVSEYLYRTNELFGSWKDSNLSEDCQERSEETLRELESHMDYIKAAVERKLYPNGR